AEDALLGRPDRHEGRRIRAAIAARTAGAREYADHRERETVERDGLAEQVRRAHLQIVGHICAENDDTLLREVLLVQKESAECELVIEYVLVLMSRPGHAHVG